MPIKLIWNFVFTILTSIITRLTSKKSAVVQTTQTTQTVQPIQTKQEKPVQNQDNFFIHLGEQYFENWIYGEPIIIDEKITDTHAIQCFLKGFNDRMLARGSNDQAKFREKINLLYELATLIRNVEGKSPSTTGDALGQALSRLRIIDGARFDSEVLKIKKKEL